MSQLLEEALSRLRDRPAADQDLAAELIFNLLERDEPSYRLTAEQVAEVEQTLADLESGRARLLTVEETEEMWRRLGV